MSIEINNSFAAQDIAGKAILFEIGAQAGIVESLERKSHVTVQALATELCIQKDFLASYLDTFKNLNLLDVGTDPTTGETVYQKTSDFAREKNKIGYISWGMQSCGPLLANTKAFTTDFDSAVRTHHRCGEHVARTSKWMGEKDFYPHAEETILKLHPKKIVDLGSGTCGLLIRLAHKIKDLTGIGVDVSKDACDDAKSQLKKANLEKRIEVFQAPIQRLLAHTRVFKNADVIHAGFVFHDLLPEEERTLDALLSCISTTVPNATLVIVDAVPFSQHEHERAFSSAFSFLHKFFMGRKLLSESAWQSKLEQAGFKNIEIKPLGISGGRIFVAKTL